MKPKFYPKHSKNEDDFVTVGVTSKDCLPTSRLDSTFSAQANGVVDKVGNYVKSDDFHPQRRKKRQESIGGVINLTAQEIENIFDSASKMYGIAD